MMHMNTPKSIDFNSFMTTHYSRITSHMCWSLWHLGCSRFRKFCHLYFSLLHKLWKEVKKYFWGLYFLCTKLLLLVLSVSDMNCKFVKTRTPLTNVGKYEYSHCSSDGVSTLRCIVDDAWQISNPNLCIVFCDDAPFCKFLKVVRLLQLLTNVHNYKNN